MASDRRTFLKAITGVSAGLAAGAAPQAIASAAGHGHAAGPEDPMGVLVDLTLCIGCRHCEHACKKENGNDPGSLESYDDKSVFATRRRPGNDAFTVINEYPQDVLTLTPTGEVRRDDTDPGQGAPVYAKINCMHCNHAACVSACIVGALQKRDDGAVVYEAWKCIGCRYCMVACPFGVPTYEYGDAFTPRVRKCEMCHETRTGQGKPPACVEACPRQAMIYGKRSELIAHAHRCIREKPEKYINHVYGEHEVGGTSWMYLSPVPFEKVGMLKLGSAAPPALTEAIQHGVFKYWIAPVSWYAFLAGSYWWTGRKRAVSHQPSAISHDQAHDPQASSHEPQASHHEHHETAAPVDHPLLTPGVWALIAIVAVGALAWCYRMVVGLEATTNLSQQYPWGLWIAMDVGSGIALAGGGFVTAALAHVFHRQHYHAIARSALLTALLGYTFYVPGLLADIGRWYNIWHPNLPSMWQGNSVLFEVGICVMIYLNVQYAELAPIVCERVIGEKHRWPRLAEWARFTQKWLNKAMPALLCLGVCLSTFHQSSLGNLMVIAPYKLHPLWWTPWSPLMFLQSAMMVGFPMVIFTMLTASWSLKRDPEMHVLAPLGRIYVPIFLSLYLAVKVADMAWRGTHTYLLDGSYEGRLWLMEMALVVVPLAMFLSKRCVRAPRLLATAAFLVIAGVVLNRLNVFVLAYHPPFAEGRYFPSVVEFLVSAGLVAALLLAYRVAVTYLPILDPRPLAREEVAGREMAQWPSGPVAQ